MLGYADWIVGSVALVLGVTLCWSAVQVSPWLFALPKVQWLERRLGNRAAQAILLVIGLVMIGLGIAIAAGWKVNWPSDRHTTLLRIEP